MRVLMISGDTHLLTPGTEASKRLELQRTAVEHLDVFVWPQQHSAWQIYRAARKNHYDVITAQDPFWRGLLAWKIARLTGAKLNLQVHADLAAQSLFRRALASLSLRHADSIRVVSEKIRDHVRAIGTKAHISVVPVYIDVSRFENLIREPHEQKTILWIGRFEPEKDPLYAIYVLKEVRSKDCDAKLVMLGTGSLENALRQHAKILPIELPGWQDPKSYLQTADVVLSTSKHESYGASMIEALAAGVPVVAPDVGVAREAGAIITTRLNLAGEIVRVLSSGGRGELKLPMQNREEWAQCWKGTLV